MVFKKDKTKTSPEKENHVSEDMGTHQSSATQGEKLRKNQHIDAWDLWPAKLWEIFFFCFFHSVMTDSISSTVRTALKT